ncbi:hypothetical protein BH09PAT1_BH09PAT1_1680 [soil metagenome]
MGNINLQHWRADYLLHQFIIYFSHVKNSLHISFFFSPIIVISVIFFVIALLIARYLCLLRRSLTEKSVLLELTPPAFSDKSAYTTEQLFSVIHGLGKNQKFLERLLGIKPKLSFEIVSTKNQGIRYIVRTIPRYAHNFKRYMLSYLPQVQVKETQEFVPAQSDKTNIYNQRVVEFKLARHFAYPLQKQQFLEQHDPVAYITGMMTQLSPQELLAFQIVVSPTHMKEAKLIKHMIHHNEDVLAYLDRIRIPSLIKPVGFVLNVSFKLIGGIVSQVRWTLTELLHPATIQSASRQQGYQYQQIQIQQHIKPARTLTRFEQETVQSIQEKIDQPLFETTIRLLVMVKENREQEERIDGFITSLGNFAVPGYQSIIKSNLLPDFIWRKVRSVSFKKRLLSLLHDNGSSLLSSSEIADLYHFPFQGVNQTENIVKVYAKELPAPLSLKQGRKLDVVFGKNSYGGVTTDIGLTAEQRETHTYILGRTGSGKTTLMFSMAKHDIESGRGMGFIDPHGDVSEDLLSSVPLERKDDLIYINPWDIKHPVGINVMELSEGLDEDEQEMEKEIVCEGVISLFKKVFSKDENTNAHRIEHILRNTIYTAFYAEDRTLFTINKLLTDTDFRKKVIAKVDDEDLLNFWKSEFGKAGDFQVVKMTQGVTAKVGRFLRSPTAKRMLEQPKSTINFDDILNGKILICNLSQGKLGEDTTKLIGTTILTKLQQAALKRALVLKDLRKPFYLYIDEFQNFATLSFMKIISEGRKYGLHLVMAEQSTSQQQDRNIVNQILANVTTVIVFRSGNYIDEELMLHQFAPYLQTGDIPSLSRYHFYIKNSALDSEEPFSGETIYAPIEKDMEKMQTLIESSRRNWAIIYVKKVKKQLSYSGVKDSQSESKNIGKKSGLPTLNGKK